MSSYIHILYIFYVYTYIHTMHSIYPIKQAVNGLPSRICPGSEEGQAFPRRPRSGVADKTRARDTSARMTKDNAYIYTYM